MKIYNTLTKKKEEFVPLEEGKVIQLYSYWKCTSDDCIRYRKKIYGIQRL